MLLTNCFPVSFACFAIFGTQTIIKPKTVPITFPMLYGRFLKNFTTSSTKSENAFDIFLPISEKNVFMLCHVFEKNSFTVFHVFSHVVLNQLQISSKCINSPIFEKKSFIHSQTALNISFTPVHACSQLPVKIPMNTSNIPNRTSKTPLRVSAIN